MGWGWGPYLSRSSACLLSSPPAAACWWPGRRLRLQSALARGRDGWSSGTELPPGTGDSVAGAVGRWGGGRGGEALRCAFAACCLQRAWCHRVSLVPCHMIDGIACLLGWLCCPQPPVPTVNPWHSRRCSPAVSGGGVSWGPVLPRLAVPGRAGGRWSRRHSEGPWLGRVCLRSASGFWCVLGVPGAVAWGGRVCHWGPPPELWAQ